MDENSKIVDGGVAKTAAEEESLATNPNPIPDVITSNSDSSVDDGGANPLTAANDESEVVARSRQSSRTPFANLSQADADLALARTLQEQVICKLYYVVFSFYWLN